jgi:hypothetical protein
MKGKNLNKDFKIFISEIIDEHYQLTKGVDSNLNYLWYLYKQGTNAGEYKPFILMAEMQLLKEMGYITADEIETMWNMIDSEDSDNFNLVWLALRTWRLARLKDHGVYTKSNFAYMNVEKDYSVKILNQQVFLKDAKK